MHDDDRPPKTIIDLRREVEAAICKSGDPEVVKRLLAFLAELDSVLEYVDSHRARSGRTSSDSRVQPSTSATTDSDLTRPERALLD